MFDEAPGDLLAATEHIVLVLRLVAQPNGEVLYGEVLNAGGNAREGGLRFVGLDGIADAVRTCVANSVPGADEAASAPGQALSPRRTERSGRLTGQRRT